MNIYFHPTCDDEVDIRIVLSLGNELLIGINGNDLPYFGDPCIQDFPPQN